MHIRPALVGTLLLVPVTIAIPAPLPPGGDTPTMNVDVRPPAMSSAPPSESSGPSGRSSTDRSTESKEPKPSGGDGSSARADGGSGGSEAQGIEFTNWTLQLPIGSPGKPQSIPGSKLSGYKDPKKEYYYTDSSTGAVVMKVPGSPHKTSCVTTPNSKHCRTELRETKPASWDPKSNTNSMTATLKVVKADDSGKGTCIGQIHIDENVSVRPVCELYYSQDGVLSMGVARTIEGGNQVLTEVGKVAIGTKFSYTIAYEKGKLSVAVNGKSKVLSTYKLNSPPSYFKAGNYNQGNGASEVHFYDVQVKH